MCLPGRPPRSAEAGALLPRGKKIFFGISDTGDSADFGQFSKDLDKHPALIESFRTWGSDFPESIERWQEARARPVLHITTADNNDGHELISPRAIAQGYGDDYLIRLNRLFWEKKMRAYIRPLGEPNRCLNVYASYDCDGQAARRRPQHPLVQTRLPPHLRDRPRRRQARARSTPACAEAGLPPLRSDVGGLPQGADRGDLEPAARRLADRPPKPAAPLLPRRRLGRLGRHRHLLRQPGLEGAGRPLQALLEQALRAPRVGRLQRRRLRLRAQADDLGRPPPRAARCSIYYQDFGSTSSYRIQN